MVWGDPVPEYVIFKVPFAGPVAVGLKTTDTWHVADGGKLVGQVLVCV